MLIAYGDSKKFIEYCSVNKENVPISEFFKYYAYKQYKNVFLYNIILQESAYETYNLPRYYTSFAVFKVSEDIGVLGFNGKFYDTLLAYNGEFDLMLLRMILMGIFNYANKLKEEQYGTDSS